MVPGGARLGEPDGAGTTLDGAGSFGIIDAARDAEAVAEQADHGATEPARVHYAGAFAQPDRHGGADSTGTVSDATQHPGAADAKPDPQPDPDRAEPEPDPEPDADSEQGPEAAPDPDPARAHPAEPDRVTQPRRSGPLHTLCTW